MLNIIPPRLALIIIAARELEAELGASGGAAPGRARRRLVEAIGRCAPSELAELIALAWIGRGDFDATDFAAALCQSRRLLGACPVEYLAEMRDLAAYLERAAKALGLKVEEFKIVPA